MYIIINPPTHWQTWGRWRRGTSSRRACPHSAGGPRARSRNLGPEPRRTAAPRKGSRPSRRTPPAPGGSWCCCLTSWTWRERNTLKYAYGYRLENPQRFQHGQCEGSIILRKVFKRTRWNETKGWCTTCVGHPGLIVWLKTETKLLSIPSTDSPCGRRVHRKY